MEAREVPHSPVLANDTVESIDRELAKYDILVLNLKSRRNKVVPISRLPPEVLSTIFFFASRLGISGIEWTKITHVCRYWRDLALDTPSLWSNPPLHSSRWTEVMLDRSKMASLTVQVEGNTHHQVNALQKLFDIVENYSMRIKCIQIDSVYGYRLKNLPSSMPNLESLVITNVHGRLGGPYTILDESLRDTGRLQHLELEGLSINWELHLPDTLTVLKLHNIRCSDTSYMEKLLNALERMSLLQTLDLAGILPSMVKPSSPSRIVNLGKLQKLKLSASELAQPNSFLRALTFPSTTFVQIEIDCEPPGASECPDVSGFFLSVARSRKGSVQIKTLDLTFSTEPPSIMRRGADALHVRAFTSSTRPTGSHLVYKRTPLTDLRLFGQQPMSLGPLLRDLIPKIPLENLRNLSLIGPVDTLAVRTLLDTIGALPRVRTLTITMAPKLFRALKSHLHRLPGYSGRPSPISFPSLRNLVLKGEFVEEFTAEPDDVTVEMLLDCLEWRSNCGSPVKWLNVEECKGIDRFEVDRLEEVVEEIVWDPDFDSDSDDEDLFGGYEDEEEEEDEEEDEYEEEEEEEEEEEDEQQDLFEDGYDEEPELGLEDLFDPDDPDIAGFEDFY